jgi:hypothetical protein
MALHRDIYWVGKQWAVTGHGIQACNQKQRSRFDIEASRLWEDGVQDAVRAETWVNTDDFEKAVANARKYYPEPPRKTPPPAEPVSPPQPVRVPQPPLKAAAPKFDMCLEGLRAKLTPVWRIRTPVAVQRDNQPSERGEAG